MGSMNPRGDEGENKWKRDVLDKKDYHDVCQNLETFKQENFKDIEYYRYV